MDIMAMAWIWTILTVGAVAYGAVQGTIHGLAAAALEGAQAGIGLCITMAGAICLWSGVMEVMERCGMASALAKLLRPVLRWILPEAGRDETTMHYLSGNMAANFLGLGNAATPLGVRATERMSLSSAGTASDEMCRLVVLNTASIQLLPTTAAALRASCGCATPFDILPCVWISSVLSVMAGLGTAWLLGKIWR